MRRSTRDRAAGLVALGALGVLVVGVPVLLVRIAGWPLPTEMPDWDRVRRGISQGDVPAAAVVNALAVVVWLIWFQLVWALVWELVVNVPRATAGRVARPAPLVAPSVGNGVGRLVALVLAIGNVVASTPGAAVALPTTPASAFMPLAPTSLVKTPPERAAALAATAATPRWAVERADSLWKIAETALGDGERASEILEHNQWLGSPRHLRPGQLLDLPADATVPADRQAQPVATAGEPPPDSAAVAPAAAYLEATRIVIEPGDTLWDLAEGRLAMVDDDVTPAETLALVDEVVATNPDVVEDPNLIYAGEIFTFPAVGTPPPEPPQPRQPAAEQPAAADLPPAEPTPASSIPSSDVEPEMPQVALEPAVPAAPTTIDATARPAEDGLPPVTDLDRGPVTAGHAARFDAPSESSATRWLVGVSGATALASGLLLLYRRRLAVRAARGAKAYRATIPDDPSVLTAVTRASDVPLMRWANAQLAALTSRLRPDDIAGQPLAVELSETFGIEVLWTESNVDPPSPWQISDGGWSWILPYESDAPVDNTDRPAAIPALVTIGSRDGNQLLVNLEAVGTLAVDSDDQAAADFVRALVAELAVGEILSDAYLVTSGLDLAGFAGLDRVQRRDRAGAAESLSAAVGASRAFLTDYSLSTAFAARLGGDATGRETTIVAVDDEYAEPLGDVAPGLSVSLVYTGAPTTEASVKIDDDGHAILLPYGIEFRAATLPLPSIEAVAGLLDDVAEPFYPPAPTEDSVADADTEQDATTDSLGDGDGWEFPEPAVLVRVFGAPEVVGADLGRIETSIVTYLACHDGKRRDEQVINAVWNGRAVEPKTLWNKISNIRAVLGPGLVPARLPNSPNVVLSHQVMTDLAVLARLLARAEHVAASEALELLRHGLDLVDGVPFDSAEYDWSFESQDHAAACETVEAAALRCVDIAMDLGDLVAARHAVCQGLRALPMNEPLYRARMQIEAASGNPDGVRRALGELTTALNSGSGGSEPPAEPEAETMRVARALASA